MRASDIRSRLRTHFLIIELENAVVASEVAVEGNCLTNCFARTCDALVAIDYLYRKRQGK